MADTSIRFCKFCGEQVDYLLDFKDYFCRYCYSYQTRSEAIESQGKKEQVKVEVDSSLPPTYRP